MKRKISILLCITFLLGFLPEIKAGNEQRTGQAGASELLINPWVQSSGFGNANTSCVRGLEGIFMNVAGTAFTKKTEIIFVRTDYLRGSDIKMNAFGLTQRVGESGAASIAVMTMDFGDIMKTTVENPDGGLGTFNPKYSVISISYAKEFSNSIYGGMTLKMINESISDLKANGWAIDAGIQYVTGEQRQIHFGVTMQNVGSTMKFNGDGYSFRGYYVDGPTETMQMRAADFELPSLIRIGIAYDIILAVDADKSSEDDPEAGRKHVITIAGNFTSNSFTQDQFHLGMQYSFRNFLSLRGGFVYEKDIFSKENRKTAFDGPTGGISINLPLNREKGSVFAIEYSYRSTTPFDGTHSIGARVTL